MRNDDPPEPHDRTPEFRARTPAELRDHGDAHAASMQTRSRYRALEPHRIRSEALPLPLIAGCVALVNTTRTVRGRVLAHGVRRGIVRWTRRIAVPSLLSAGQPAPRSTLSFQGH
jgi:hypothetical protein